MEKLINIPKGVKVSIFSDNLGKMCENTYLDFCKEYTHISVKLYKSGGIFHDRYIILDYDTLMRKSSFAEGLPRMQAEESRRFWRIKTGINTKV